MFNFRAMWEELRKFGLEYCDLPTMIGNIGVLLRPLTVNIDSTYKKGMSRLALRIQVTGTQTQNQDKHSGYMLFYAGIKHPFLTKKSLSQFLFSGIPLIFYIVTGVSYIFYLYIYLICMLWFVFVRSPVTGQKDSAMIAASLGICSEIGTIKLLFMLLYIDKIRALTDEFRDFDSKTALSSRFSKNLQKHLRSTKKRAITYWTFMSINGVLFMTKHFIIPEHLTQDTFVLYGNKLN
ncbi:uncharacterized protein LOC113503956 [Trichoplusia ni]|uniref:Uncharacterized protein LOC113503956 n=1 Tax=Trichoplusia ni TaxID=7111 RepID=A0A7E5WNJ0_TRINI|nr:uncharacterized protein LOC113503956 [Trichoplusia ni]